jgi:hypothetical protein
MRDAARRCECINLVAAPGERRKCDEVRRGDTIQDQRVKTIGIRAHMAQRERLGAALEAFEERHMTREMTRVFCADAAAPVHSGKVIDTLLAGVAHPLGHQLPCTQHTCDFLVRAAQDGTASVIDDRIERVAEAIRALSGRIGHGMPPDVGCGGC